MIALFLDLPAPNVFLLTEGGLVDYGYDKFAKLRYSNKTLNQASAVFTWGEEDFETLKKNFKKQRSATKIYKDF